MNAPHLVFTLQDDSLGYEVSPDRVPLAWVREFTQEVEDFLRGTRREISTTTIEVSIVPGSFSVISAAIVAAPLLLADVESLARTQLLDALDPKRRFIVEIWQKRARKNTRRGYSLGDISMPHRVTVSAATDFHVGDADRWVESERVVRGIIFDMGGKASPNVHIALDDGTTLQVAADKTGLEQLEKNLLYKSAMLRVRASYNVVTREYRNAVLIDFINYEPRYSDAERSRLIENGTRAWKDVDDATRWVEELRGNA